jgi:hypothetical protein
MLVGVFWLVEAFAERDTNELWWFSLIGGVAMIIVAFWTAGQFFIEKVYVRLRLRRHLGSFSRSR